MIRDFKFDLQRFDSTFSGGTGTESDPYIISNLADLEQFKRDVNGGNNYSGKYFKVTNDITLTSDTWTPIGVFGKSFSGTFDGDGHSISGLTAMHENHDFVDGFFGYTNGGATIKNVHLTNVRIRSDYYTIGALVADVNDGTQIINCSVQGTVEVGGIGVYAGGLVGKLWSGSMTNCAFLGTFKLIDSVQEAGIIASLSASLDGNYYLGDYDNLNPNGATRIYNVTVPDNVTSSAIVSFVGKDYIKKGEVTFNYLGGTYKYNVNGDVTLTLKDNKLFANDTDLGAVFPATLDGDGSQNNPFLIKTESQLRLLATYVNYGNNCAGLNFKLADDINLTSNWNPIGDSKNNFSGTFDGDGKTISKLKINDATSDGQGLFGFTNNATIKNVNLTGVNVTGKNNVGALIGSAAGKTQVTNCSASGTVKGSENIGGLVGSNSGTIKNSALLGGTVVGTTKGAIAGKNSGTLTDNYYLGDLKGADSNGATKIFKLAAPGNVTSSAIVTLNGMKYVKAGDATFTYNGKTYNRTVTDDLAIAVQGNNLSFDKLDTAENFLSTLEGNGSEKNPYIIKTESHLRQLATYVNYGNNCAGKNFKLANDIALTSNWIPIGNSSNKFKGAFDGGEKIISNLTINDTTSDGQGLFGYTNGATIKNFNLTGVNVTGKNNVGSLVGNAAGKTQVTNCSVQGTVKGSENVGGLVGSNSGTIKDSALLNGTIDGNTRGAIVGKNSGKLTGNYYLGALAEGVNDNGATQIFNVTLPEGVTSNEVVTFNGTNYIKAGDVTFNYNGKNYSFNVASETTVTINDGKIFVNNTNPEANFPGNLDGDGSESNPYIIKTERHLRQLATYVNAGNNCKGLNFKLANDIALTNDWTAIGVFGKTFNGNFDGDGHTISNLTADDSSMNYQGLFGNIDNATIKNVNLTGVNFRGKYRVSSLVASAKNNSQILNCSASGNLKSNGLASYLGGIVAHIGGDTTVDGCTFRGNISGLKLPDNLFLFGSHVGGIVGVYNDGTVKNCAYLGGNLSSSNSGAIVSTSREGAFVDNYYLGKLGEGVKDSGATQIFNVSLPDDVTSNSLVTLNGTKYIKAGDVTFNFNGGTYNYKVAGDVTVTIQDGKLFFNDNSPALTSSNSLWGTPKSDALIYGGGSFKTNNLDEITANYNAGNNYVSADSFALKNFMTKTFAGNNDALTLSGGSIKK